MDDSNKDDHAKTLPKEHDRDAAIDDARKAPEELEDEGLRCRIGRVGRMVSFWARHPPESPYPFSNNCPLQPGTARHQALSDVW